MSFFPSEFVSVSSEDLSVVSEDVEGLLDDAVNKNISFVNFYGK